MAKIEILNIDCMEYMAGLEDNAFDLVITSPPYNLGVSTGGGIPQQKGKWSGAALKDGYGAHDDAMPYEKYVEWQKSVLLECWRLLRVGGAIYYNHKCRVQGGVLQTPLDLNPGLPVRQIITWSRPGGVNFSPTHYMPASEWIVIFAKPEFRLKSKEASGVGDVWEMPIAHGNPHPAPFPLQLPERILETTGGGRIFDPFMGSGTTAIAAHYGGFDFVGCEIDEDYYKAACERFDMETRQEAMF